MVATTAFCLLTDCGAERTTVVQGTPGPKGDTGTAGVNGIDGSDGETGSSGHQGSTGPQGETVQGPAGSDGTSCSVSPMIGGALVTCSDGTQAVVLNGLDGANGTDGQDGIDTEPGVYDIIEIINPCGVNGPYDEVLLRLRNGQIIAYYSAVNKQRLAVLVSGSYITTDGYSCAFAIDVDGNII